MGQLFEGRQGNVHVSVSALWPARRKTRRSALAGSIATSTPARKPRDVGVGGEEGAQDVPRRGRRHGLHERRIAEVIGQSPPEKSIRKRVDPGGGGGSGDPSARGRDAEGRDCAAARRQARSMHQRRDAIAVSHRLPASSPSFGAQAATILSLVSSLVGSSTSSTRPSPQPSRGSIQ